MKKSIDFSVDDHPTDDEERPRAAWAVAVSDDCEPCGDARVEVTFEEEGGAGLGVVAHLGPDTARRLRQAIAVALREIGEPDA
ncbi:MAG: hypothetical protein M3Z84_09660 [Actinomycetota bacterium]|nr:hypothetical protein [Actinomycetota bacterium]